ncbi:hypothetical protein [Neoasaia chiangmaiensis]|nr:hypothetical protein [Neoasaia chiangmaiensis]
MPMPVSPLRFMAVFLPASAMLAACTPIDQRTFDPNAGRRPVAHVPPAPAAKPPPPPFLQIMSGTPEATWRPAVDHAARVALARKPNVLFVVTAIATPSGTPANQTEALTQMLRREERAVADAIVSAGVPDYQIQLNARTEPAAAPPRIRVDVR